MFRKFALFANKSLCHRIIFTIFFVLMLLPSVSVAYKSSQYRYTPPFLVNSVTPSVSIVLDTSGSMTEHAYRDTLINFHRNNDHTGYAGFNSTKEYYGYWNSKLYYSYDTINNYFLVDAAGLWNGNFLNWLAMHRMDVARKVLTGGPYNTATGSYEVVATEAWGDRGRFHCYDDTSPVLDLNGNVKHMTPYAVRLGFDQQSGTIQLGVHQVTGVTPGTPDRWDVSSTVDATFTLRVHTAKVTGVIDAFEGQLRMALFKYDDDDDLQNGGEVVSYMTDNATQIATMKDSINSIYPVSWTPLAETYYTVCGYIRQDATGTWGTGPHYEDDSYTTGTTTDPYYFSSEGGTLSCSQQNVIIITDGESTQDQNIPTAMQNIVPGTTNYTDSGTDHLLDIAKWSHATDMRSDLSGTQTVNLYAVFAFGSGSDMLKNATIYGGFKDKNGNGEPDAGEYDSDNDGQPDNYFAAESGQALELSLLKAFGSMVNQPASGTAVAVISQSRSGGGVTYQTVFYPQREDVSGNIVNWAGQLHALWVDDNGNLREDTNNNNVMDLATDKIIIYTTSGVRFYVDSNGDSELSAAENATVVTGSLYDIHYVWNSNSWLNEIDDSSVVSQRSSYSSLSNNRHIMTFADINDDMVVNNSTGELQVFQAPTMTPTQADLNSTSNFYTYLNVAPSFGDIPVATVKTWRTSYPALYLDFVQKQTRRIIDFVRGADQGNATITGNSQTRTLSSMRPRKFDYDLDSTAETWRMGDVVYSSPAVVGKPADNYHLLYKSETYRQFYKQYVNRRNVVYVGANDGMVHAFNAGFYNATTKTLNTTIGSQTAFPIGMELWAYVPYNLLPHLYWLTETDYEHVCYMDMEPRIFDARVFAADAAHPYGWGTLMICGMRLGGAYTQADINKFDGLDTPSASDRTMSSAFVIFDITNPEEPPRVIAELRFPGQGFSTCSPGIFPMASKGSGPDNEWYLVLGSGPADSSGLASSSVLSTVTSSQNGKLCVLDLKKLVQNEVLSSLTANGVFASGLNVFAQTEAKSFVSDILTMDFDLNFKTDALYYGTVAGNSTSSNGTLYRMVTNDTLPVSGVVNWVGNSTLVSVNRPISSYPSVAIDDEDRFWVYFGTGRYYTALDRPLDKTMVTYGVREPVNATGHMTYTTVDTDDLFNGTAVKVYSLNQVQFSNGTNGTWADLETVVDGSAGWLHDLNATTGERCLTQASILGGAIFFTTYAPSLDPCSTDGSSNLYGLYYKTGTAYYKPIMGANADASMRFVGGLGQGMASSPSLGVNSKGQLHAYIQRSDGTIEKVELVPPYRVISGRNYWREN